MNKKFKIGYFVFDFNQNKVVDKIYYENDGLLSHEECFFTSNLYNKLLVDSKFHKMDQYFYYTQIKFIEKYNEQEI